MSQRIERISTNTFTEISVFLMANIKRRTDRHQLMMEMQRNEVKREQVNGGITHNNVYT